MAQYIWKSETSFETFYDVDWTGWNPWHDCIAVRKLWPHEIEIGRKLRKKKDWATLIDLAVPQMIDVVILEVPVHGEYELEGYRPVIREPEAKWVQPLLELIYDAIPDLRMEPGEPMPNALREDVLRAINDRHLAEENQRREAYRRSNEIKLPELRDESDMLVGGFLPGEL